MDIGPAELVFLLQASNKPPGGTVPAWVALTSALAAPVVSGAGAYLTVLATNRRERERLASERQGKAEDEQRKDRLQVYRSLAKATRTIEPSDKPPEEMRDLADALAEIELLTDSPRLRDAANELFDATTRARNERDRYQKSYDANAGHVSAEVKDAEKEAVERAEQLRARFIEAAKSELDPVTEP